MKGGTPQEFRAGDGNRPAHSQETYNFDGVDPHLAGIDDNLRTSRGLQRCNQPCLAGVGQVDDRAAGGLGLPLRHSPPPARHPAVAGRPGRARGWTWYQSHMPSSAYPVPTIKSSQHHGARHTGARFRCVRQDRRHDASGRSRCSSIVAVCSASVPEGHRIAVANPAMSKYASSRAWMSRSQAFQARRC